jgi:hypothetical protein
MQLHHGPTLRAILNRSLTRRGALVQWALGHQRASGAQTMAMDSAEAAAANLRNLGPNNCWFAAV